MPLTVAPPIRGLIANASLKYGLTILAAVVAVAALFPGVLGNLFRADQFMPHATCYLRNPGVILLHVSSDLLIGFAYVSISVTLGYMIEKASGDIPFHLDVFGFRPFHHYLRFHAFHGGLDRLEGGVLACGVCEIDLRGGLRGDGCGVVSTRAESVRSHCRGKGLRSEGLSYNEPTKNSKRLWYLVSHECRRR